MLFPIEIWLDILEHLQTSICTGHYDYCTDGCPNRQLETIRTLSRVSRTSKWLHRLAQPIMYRHIPVGLDDIQDALLQSLLNNEHLAELVRHVDFCEGGFALPEQQHNFAAAQHRLPLSVGVKTRLMSSLYDEDEDGYKAVEAWTAFYMALLPRLEILEMNSLMYTYLLPSIFREAIQEPVGPLRNLREIWIRHWDTEFASAVSDYQEVLLLPNLHTFHGSEVEWDTNLTTHEDFASLKSVLRRVHLSRSLIEDDGLRDMLESCPFLQTLQIHWGSATVGDSSVDLNRFGDALRSFGCGLQTLDLDCRECCSYEWARDDWRGRIGPLGELKHLKHLSLPQDVLLGVRVQDTGGTLEQALPSSLESLQLYSCYDDPERVARDIIGVVRSQTLTRLRQITLPTRAWAGEMHLEDKVDVNGWRVECHSEYMYQTTTLIKDV